MNCKIEYCSNFNLELEKIFGFVLKNLSFAGRDFISKLSELAKQV